MDSENIQLREALLHLSWPAELQERWLRSAGMWQLLDELALDLDAAPMTAETDAGELARLLSELGDLLGGTSNDGACWEGAALKRHQWHEVRTLSASALTALDGARAFAAR